MAGEVIEPGSLSNENYQVNWSMGTLYFLDGAVVKPVGKENPEIQKMLGCPFATQDLSCSTRLLRSAIHRDKGLREE